MNSEYIKNQFRRYDQDMDGYLKLAEATAACSEIGINKTDITAIIKSMKLKEDQDIPLDDFIEEVKYYCVSKMKKDPFRIMFQRLDRDGSGFLDFDEVKMATSAFGQIAKDCKVRDLFSMADTNKDGKIDVEEYMEFLSKLHSKKLLFYLLSDKNGLISGFKTPVNQKKTYV